MAETKKNTKGKMAAKSPKQAPEKTTKKGGDIFGDLKKHFEPKKVDDWQKKWLAIPENRKKYEKITDAPEVVGEELTAMVNDIIDFAQGEEGGKSHLFSKLKKGVGGLFKKATGAVKSGAEQAKKQAGKVADAGTKQVKKVGKPAKK